VKKLKAQCKTQAAIFYKINGKLPHRIDDRNREAAVEKATNIQKKDCKKTQ
jgi:hypothetical protein